jgi:hypothetical protein
MHAVETIQRLTSIDPTFAEEVERLRLSIRNWPVDGGTTPPRPPSGGDGPGRDAQG